jgi:hypothetical protein
MYAHHFAKPPDDVPLISQVEAAATAYLDGKPRRRGKHKVAAVQRDQAFWTCTALNDVPAEAWQAEVLTLALAWYFTQEGVAHEALLARLAERCPEVVIRAVRRSGMVARAAPLRRLELQRAAAVHPAIAELCRVLAIFEEASRVRVEEVAQRQFPLADLTPFELLLQASLYAFEHLVPSAMASPHRERDAMSSEQVAWHAISDVMRWKLATALPEAFDLDDESMGRSLANHLGPVLRASPATLMDGRDTRDAFRALLEAQIELNEFVSRSADAFSYDDAVRFVRRGDGLEIEEADAALRAAWWRDGRKLARLHDYWFYRAMDEFLSLPIALQTIGRPENHEANRLAYLRAMRSQLQLTHVYGVADTVSNDEGEVVDLFQALLALELTSAFFQRDFLEVFAGHHREAGHWMPAVQRLAAGGLAQGLQNRFPLTWSERADKIKNIVGWTVTPAPPQGSALMASRILDFWTSDWKQLASKLNGAPDSQESPELFERPFLRFGRHLVQLPWLTGLQNNSTAALNNLRRLGQRRGEFRAETERIEAGLGRALAARGFAVVLNWNPPRETYGDAGEVDVICARDGLVIVMEVKSSLLRMSQRDAWSHATSTQRKAGAHLQRKVAAVNAEIGARCDARADPLQGSLADRLGLEAGALPLSVHGWIVDTSIECDHQFFSGFLKVSLEEVLIALRDDTGLLEDPANLSGGHASRARGEMDDEVMKRTLYPSGFNGARFVVVIESEAVWEAAI